MENNRKICKQCGNLEEHGVNRDKPDGLMGSRCKKCELIRRRAYLAGRTNVSAGSFYIRSLTQIAKTAAEAMEEGCLMTISGEERDEFTAALERLIAANSVQRGVQRRLDEYKKINPGV